MTETDSEAEFHKILGVHPLIQLYLYWQAVFGRFILSIFSMNLPFYLSYLLPLLVFVIAVTKRL